MKKIFLLLMIILLSSCSFDGKENEDDNKEEEIVNVNNYDNIPVEEFKPYKETYNNNSAWNLEGDGSFVSELNKKQIVVNNGGVTLKSSPFMMKNGNYNVSFISTNSGHIKIASNDDVYLDSDFEIGDVSLDYRLSDINYEVVVSLSFAGNSEIDDFSISCDNKSYKALVNQVTYLDSLNKQVVFNNNPGNYYSIYNIEDNSKVYTGNVSEAYFEKDTNQWLYKGYFSDLNVNGTYYIKTEFGCYSREFVINDEYNELIEGVLEAIYLQRCGYDTEGILGHPACHTTSSKVYSYDKEEYIDTTGGWHDAGDYGKYGVVENKVIADLLFSHMYGDNKDE